MPVARPRRTRRGCARATQVQKVSERRDRVEYLVHYKGWSDKWDEWVSEERVMPKNDKTRACEATATSRVPDRGATRA